MNLTVLNNTNELTMSSREIAEKTGKRHADVMRDIRVMLSGIFPAYADSADLRYLENQGVTFDTCPQTKRVSVIHLSKDLTMTLVLGYDHKARHKVITRWLELEEEAAKSKAPAVTLPDFTDPIAAARAWIAAMEQAKEVTEKLIEAQPKVEAFDHFMETEGHFGLRAAAKVLGISKPNKFTEWLRATGVLFKDGRGQNQPYASRSSGGG